MEIDDYKDYTDQQLIKLCREGDSVAFEHLFNRYRSCIHQLYMHRTGGNADDSNDLLQETFVKVYLNIHRYSETYTFGQWVYTIARNTFIDYTRRRRGDMVSIDSRNDSGSDMPIQSGPTPEESLITDQDRAEFDVLMDKMPPKYRILIELRFLREFSYEEIAAELKMPLGTVKTQIHRAREQMCRLIIQAEDTITYK